MDLMLNNCQDNNCEIVAFPLMTEVPERLMVVNVEYNDVLSVVPEQKTESTFRNYIYRKYTTILLEYIYIVLCIAFWTEILTV